MKGFLFISIISLSACRKILYDDLPHAETVIANIHKAYQKPPTEFINLCPEDSIAFAGSVEQWRIYLNRCITLDSSFVEDIPMGNYHVMIMFEVSQKGAALDPEILNDPGYGFGEKGLAIFKSYKGVWHLPPKNEGKKAFYYQPIIFQIEDE